MISPLERVQLLARSIERPIEGNPRLVKPQTGQFFHRRAAIVAPAADGSENVIVAYTVPKGFNAILTHLLVTYTGDTPPLQGVVTDILYAMRIDGTSYAKDFGEIVTSLGSFDSGPYPIPGGLEVGGNVLVELTVIVPAGSPIAVGGTNRVHGHLLGWEWPFNVYNSRA